MSFRDFRARLRHAEALGEILGGAVAVAVDASAGRRSPPRAHRACRRYLEVLDDRLLVGRPDIVGLLDDGRPMVSASRRRWAPDTVQFAGDG